MVRFNGTDQHGAHFRAGGFQLNGRDGMGWWTPRNNADTRRKFVWITGGGKPSMIELGGDMHSSGTMHFNGTVAANNIKFNKAFVHNKQGNGINFGNISDIIQNAQGGRPWIYYRGRGEDNANVMRIATDAATTSDASNNGSGQSWWDFRGQYQHNVSARV